MCAALSVDLYDGDQIDDRIENDNHHQRSELPVGAAWWEDSELVQGNRNSSQTGRNDGKSFDCLDQVDAAHDRIIVEHPDMVTETS